VSQSFRLKCMGPRPGFVKEKKNPRGGGGVFKNIGCLRKMLNALFPTPPVVFFFFFPGQDPVPSEFNSPPDFSAVPGRNPLVYRLALAPPESGFYDTP